VVVGDTPVTSVVLLLDGDFGEPVAGLVGSTG
jgi:hypothetical protein